MAKGNVTNNVVMSARMGTTAMEEQIRHLSETARMVLDDGDPATRKAILLLISHTCGLKQKHVKKVFMAARELRRKYVP